MIEREHPKFPLLKGTEHFTYKGKDLKDTVHDFWSFQFSNLWDMQGEVGEYVVSMALGNEDPDNKSGWTQYDIDYRGKRVEVKTTAYYQPWRKDGNVSEQRTFSIRKAHSVEGDMSSPLVRNNDIYVFCLITGFDKESADPRVIDHWRFWVVPTWSIDELCGNNKTIGLNRLKKITKKKEGLTYDMLRDAVDALCDALL